MNTKDSSSHCCKQPTAMFFLPFVSNGQVTILRQGTSVFYSRHTSSQRVAMHLNVSLVNLRKYCIIKIYIKLFANKDIPIIIRLLQSPQSTPGCQGHASVIRSVHHLGATGRLKFCTVLSPFGNGH